MAEARKSGGTQQRRSAEEWREVFERRAASGLSIAAFCQREGIAQSSYERWRTQLGNAARDAGTAAPTDTGFMDAGHLGHRAKVEGSERIEIRLELGNGVSLHVVRG